MENTKRSVFGIYSSISHAERAVTSLREGGFSRADVFILVPDRIGKTDVAYQEVPHQDIAHTKASDGAYTTVYGMGIQKDEARHYEGRIRSPGVLLLVNCDTSKEIDSAKEILKWTGGGGVSSSPEATHDLVHAEQSKGAGPAWKFVSF